jgi:SLT domain-containing protein
MMPALVSVFKSPALEKQWLQDHMEASSLVEAAAALALAATRFGAGENVAFRSSRRWRI